MSPKKKADEARQEAPHSECGCPFCAAMERMRSARQRHKSLEHFYNAQIEFLSGLRSLIDETMEWMDKKAPTKNPKVTKIVVE
ncbi:MAG: hypothetical protein PVG03_11375 [Desulfarculaceae bacterium]|jgi:hypothetical protein